MSAAVSQTAVTTPAVANSRPGPELLCPAGDFGAMRAAVANGADAVYFGLPAFNARHRATNFTLESLPQTMRYLHRHNVKGFIALNVLIFSDELPDAVDYIQQIAAAGVDAVIVQDVGLVRLIKRVAPQLAVHASTQMTLTEPRGVRFAQSLGVERVVLAREMSVAEIAKVTAAVPEMPVEVFVHGAICVAYSGQCLTSESFGGRSANRGQCAQACRMPYELIVDGERRDLGDTKYLVSPTDLGAWSLVDEMTRAGIASFKIEGRLKGANYVAQTAQTYRAAIDAAVAGRQHLVETDEQEALTLVYSRGFGTGFLGGVDHSRLVPGRSPKARGLRVGTFVERTRRGFVLALESEIELTPGDGIVFDEGNPEEQEAHGQIYKVERWRERRGNDQRDQQRRRSVREKSDGRDSGANPTTDHAATKSLIREVRHVHIELGNRDAHPDDVEIGAIVWKTSDPQLNKRLASTYARDRVMHREPIDLILHAHVGAPARLTATEGTHVAEVEASDPLTRAEKFPITQEHARRQLDRLLDTPFSLGSVTLDEAGGPMVPNSTLADLRRRAVDELIELRHQATVVAVREPNILEALRSEPWQTLAHESGSNTDQPHQEDVAKLHVLARRLDQVDDLLALPAPLRPDSIYCDFEDVRRYTPAVEKCKAAGVPIALATIRIVKPVEEGWLSQVLKCEPDAVLVRNLAGIGFYRERAPQLSLIGDFSLNVANELSARVFAESGLTRMVPSYDLSWRQMEAMLRRSAAYAATNFECVVHQHIPAFHMEHCVFCATLSTGKDYRDCGRPCEQHRVELRDHLGQSHPLLPDAGCRNTMFNADPQTAIGYIPRMLGAGVRHFRVELLRERGIDEIGALVRQYRDVIAGRTEAKRAMRSLRVVSQLGVTAGTLERE